MEESQNQGKKTGGMRRILLNRWSISGVSAVLLYTLIGFFLVPYLTRHYLIRFATEDLKRQLTLKEVRFNPYVFRLELSGLAFKEGDGTPILGFERLVTDFELSSVFHWAWTFSEIILSSPSVNIQIGRDGSLNLARLADDLAGDAKDNGVKKDVKVGVPRLILQQVALNQGRIDISDLHGTEPANLEVSAIDMQLEDINTLPDRKGPYAIVAKTKDGETFKWKGEISLNPLHSQGALAVSGLRVATVWEFFRDRLRSQPPRGHVDIKTNYRFDYIAERPKLTLEGLGFRFSELELVLRGENSSILNLGTLAGKGGRLDLLTRDVLLEELSVSSGSVSVIVDESGAMNWAKLVAPAAVENRGQVSDGTKESVQPWKVLLKKVDVAEMAVAYSDRSKKHPIELGIGSAAVNFSGKIESDDEAFQAVVEGIGTRFRDMALKVAGDEEPILKVGDMEMQGGRFDLKDRNATVQQIAFRSGDARVSFSPEGELNWARAFKADDPGAVKRGVSEAGAKAAEEGFPWSLAVASIGLQDFSVALADQRPGTPASLTLEGMDLKISDVTSEGKTPLQFDLKVGVKGGGDIAVKGHTIPSAKSLEADLIIKRLTLNPLQPYLTPHVRLTLASGSLDLAGTMSYGLPKAGADLVFNGDAAISEFLLKEQDTGEAFTSWDALTLSKIHFALSPDRLTIKEVRAKKPSGKIIINEDRTVNLTQVLVKKQGKTLDAEVPKKAVSEKRPFPVMVNRVRLEEGSLAFSDLNLRPRFAVLIHQLNGDITGISSSRETRANVELDGRVDEFGLARISGEINPFDPKTYTDISMDFRNVEMTSLTPYSARFAGYHLASGKLSLDLKYDIKEGRLEGENQILVDKLTLGERIESPDAVNLPLELAIALLKDSEGKIDIGLPVKGSLDDPEFSFGKLIWKALANLLTKIVTAPFRALAGLLGIEAENLDTVTFDPGNATILPPEREKLKNLTAALQKRPNLSLEVKGIYDPAVDGRALRLASLRRELAKRQGLNLLQDEDPGPVVFDDPGTRRAIEDLFVEYHSPQLLADLREAFEKGLIPETKEGEKPSVAAEISDEAYLPFYRDLYDRLLEKAPLEPDALQQLAARRAEAIRQELLTGNEMDGARIHVLDPAAVEKSSKKAVAVKLSLSVSRKP